MNAAITVAVILAMVAVGVWIINRLRTQQRDEIASYRFGRRRRAPGARGPQLPTLPVLRRMSDRVKDFPGRTALTGGDDVGDRRDHRDGGRGRLRPRRRAVHAGGDRS